MNIEKEIYIRKYNDINSHITKSMFYHRGRAFCHISPITETMILFSCINSEIIIRHDFDRTMSNSLLAY